jgi:hypothetical protein
MLTATVPSTFPTGGRRGASFRFSALDAESTRSALANM